MDVAVTPEPGEEERRALLVALERAGVRVVDADAGGKWRRAGLCEAVEREDDGGSYAFSPRSTRGATRA